MNLAPQNRIHATSIKIVANQHLFQLIGACFFIASLCLGFVWLSGAEVEAMTFVLGLIANIFFAIPAFAERITKQKPLSEMTYDEVLSLVRSSDPRKDWRPISDERSEEFFYIKDTRLRIRHFSGEDGMQNDDFKESWANKFPDPHAYGFWYDLCIDQGRIKRFLIVAVDGLRAFIPCPDPQTMTIDSLSDRIGEIINVRTNTYMDFKKRIGIKLK